MTTTRVPTLVAGPHGAGEVMKAMDPGSYDPAEVAFLLELAAAEGPAIDSLQEYVSTLQDAQKAKLALAQVPASVLRAAMDLRRARLEPGR